MNFTRSDFFIRFNSIQKKMLEHFQKSENKEYFDIIYDKISLYNNLKNEIEEFEISIKSHSKQLNIGFVGSFSTGKSSIINSLIGEEILGVKLEPATSRITELSYGDKFEILEVSYSDDKLKFKTIDLDVYKNKSTTRITKNSNISHYIIKYPSKNLSQFKIIDTPGFSSTSKQDDQLTEKWLEKLDLLIWIFDVNKVGDKQEYEKIRKLKENSFIIGIINKVDLKPPKARYKIKNEILNEELLDDVFFYSSKKILNEFSKRKSYQQVIENISSEIRNSLNKMEYFEIKYSNPDITFKTINNKKSLQLEPIKESTYTNYYDKIINKINELRSNEINMILNQTFRKKNNELKIKIKNELKYYNKIITNELNKYSKKVDGNKQTLKASEDFFKSLKNDIENKISVSFENFITTFFEFLADNLFEKEIDSGVFSDDLYINMIDLEDDDLHNSLVEFVNDEFYEFLEICLQIYEKRIAITEINEYSEVSSIRDENHLIKTFINDLVISSVESIKGYRRNFKRQRVKSYYNALKFHKKNIDLVIPDESLKNSISTLLIYDLTDAYYLKYIPQLKNNIKDNELILKNILEIQTIINNNTNKIQ